MKEVVVGTLIGLSIAAFGLWRLEAKRMGDGGCLFPFIFGVLIISIAALVLA